MTVVELAAVVVAGMVTESGSVAVMAVRKTETNQVRGKNGISVHVEVGRVITTPAPLLVLNYFTILDLTLIICTGIDFLFLSMKF